MRRILDLRIVRWELKLLSVVAAYGIAGYPIGPSCSRPAVVPFLVERRRRRSSTLGRSCSGRASSAGAASPSRRRAAGGG